MLDRLLPLLDVCLVVLLAFPGLLRLVTARLVLALRACSCGLLLRQIGLAWVLVVLCPLLRMERTLTILVPSTLWTLTDSLPVGPDPLVELLCHGEAGRFPICSMQSSLASIFGVNVGAFSGIILAFSLLCYGRFFLH